MRLSDDHGQTWTDPARVERSGDRPDFAFFGISPNGKDLYVTYDNFLDPFRDTTDTSRRFEGVVRHMDLAGTEISNRTTLQVGDPGDARASSANALIDEFIGDYNTVSATNGGAVATYNDARNAEVCGPIDDFRQQVVDTGTGDQFAEEEGAEEEGAVQPGDTTLPEAPAPADECPTTFGNTDIYSAAVSP